MSEHEAINAVLEGNSDAYRPLVDRYHQGLIRYVYAFVLDEDVAQDIAQEAFIDAYRHLGTYDNRYAFSTWLYRIARNRALRQTKYAKRRTEFNEATADERETTAEQLDRALTAQRVQTAVASLKPDYRSAIQLYYWEDKSYEDIAVLLDTPVNTVRTWLRRAKEELRSELL